ncbi:hypothetical protein G6O67_006173 [Ophiocordyceps sinensis]|uniref:Uncharacterized protein n=1 Tax=Ophiocordyceps sinensis TaxID=72228 RepID=A0A8H4PMF9_9HYPO|nr:hypothetical protein G6O67_006173 [Ophiocordyceps sinensis]
MIHIHGVLVSVFILTSRRAPLHIAKMPWTEAPAVDFDQQPEYQWPFWEAGFQEDDLFGELHQRFNTMPNPTFIQDPDAFHHDVAEIACKALDKDDFLARLQARRDERLAELLDIRNQLWYLLSFGYSRMDDNQLLHFTHFNNFASLDTILAFWASLLSPNRHGKEPSLDNCLFLDRLRRRREANLGLKSAQTGPPPPSGPIHPASTAQSMMPTPHPHRPSASPAQPDPATQPVQKSKKRRLLPGPRNHHEHDAKRQRTGADRLHVSSTLADGSAASIPTLGIKTRAANVNIVTNDDGNTNGAPDVPVASKERGVKARAAKPKQFAGTSATQQPRPKISKRRARTGALDFNPAGSTQTLCVPRAGPCLESTWTTVAALEAKMGSMSLFILTLDQRNAWLQDTTRARSTAWAKRGERQDGLHQAKADNSHGRLEIETPGLEKE